MTETFESAALRHAAKGEDVLPLFGTAPDGTCRCRAGKDCPNKPGKHPNGKLVPNGVKDASHDPEVIRSWAAWVPKDANLARATATRPTIDIDLPDVAALLREDAALAGQTELIRTPGRDGLHIVLATTAPVKGQNLYLSDGRLLGELKGEGGYCVIPPSTIAGKSYERLSPDEVAPLLVEDPVAWLKKLLPPFGLELADSPAGGERAYTALTEGVIREGEGRHNAMKSYAGRIWVEGMSPEAFAAALKAVNAVQCDPPLPDDELRSIAQWFLNGKEQRHAREHLTAVVAASTNGAAPSPDAPETPLLLPAEVWRSTFDDYRRALEGVTEAADEHHFTAFVTVVGAVLGRRVFVDAAYRLYPNFYSLNVGPAGSTKKTTVQRLARDVVLRVDETLAVQTAAGSGEGLLEALSEADKALGETPMHRRLLLIQSEMGQLLAKARQDGSGTLIPLLLDAFDCPPMLNPKTRTKPISAFKPTLSLMAATTPSHLARYVQDADWYGGLGSRLFISIAEPKDPIPRPGKVDASRFNGVIRAIHDAVERWDEETEFKLTNEAARRWDAWYVVNKKRERELGDAADVVSRTASYAMKLGLIYAALENSTPVIEDGQIEAGILAAEFGQGCALLLLEEIGDSKTIKLEQRIVRKLTRVPGIGRRDLQRGVCGRNVGSAMFKQTIDAMVETGKVAVRPDGGLLVG